jgi:hypothetical protein
LTQIAESLEDGSDALPEQEFDRPDRPAGSFASDKTAPSLSDRVVMIGPAEW